MKAWMQKKFEQLTVYLYCRVWVWNVNRQFRRMRKRNQKSNPTSNRILFL